MALGAGAGRRLRPLTLERPKVLCPVAGRPLIDLAIERLTSVCEAVAANAHAPQQALRDHLAEHPLQPMVSIESGEALGTAGALGALAPWIDGRPVVVVNGDAWCPGDLSPLVAGWSGESIRILSPDPGPFGPRSRVAGALMPWRDVSRLVAEPSGLWEVSWRQAVDQHRVEVVEHVGPFVDCADPGDYLVANVLAAAGDPSAMVAADAEVEGEVHESVVWPGARVEPGEVLDRAIRTPNRTVLVRRPLVELGDAPAPPR